MLHVAHEIVLVGRELGRSPLIELGAPLGLVYYLGTSSDFHLYTKTW